MRLKKSILKRTRHIRALVLDYPLRPLPDPVPAPEAAPAQDTAIPRRVYQTWEENLFGRRHLAALQAFRRQNPGLTFVLLDRAARDAYMADVWGHHPVHAVYRGARFGPMQADILRYCLLHERGGYYFDINKAVTVPLDALHAPDTTALLAHEFSECHLLPDQTILRLLPHPDRYVAQWGFGFAPGHPVLARMIAAICDYAPEFAGRRFANPKSAILQLTGPGMFTRVLRQCLQDDPDLAGRMRIHGPNFDGKGNVSLDGSDVRYLRQPPYFRARDEIILDPIAFQT
ncbi:hypothetical protein GWI72_05645 [Microvirga tunisiensis]|uniref:Mannosyltransferase n=1 Tax=Pannonibacter tanglangensis TaxID=2750084 RepID=A0A7X5F0X6_9HYPH|nr:glycosyltransferase [Pannonibacter sp. XCT-53]NBN77750.1 hypothetical protein [Pannonibacter sp. XCT-53]